jgi:hypothetical protein
MPAIVHGTGHFTIDPGQTLIITATWPQGPGTGPNHGPVFAMADADDNLPVEAILITFDYSKCRHTGGPGGGTHTVFYQYKVRNQSQGTVGFRMEYYDPK